MLVIVNEILQVACTMLYSTQSHTFAINQYHLLRLVDKNILYTPTKVS